MRTLIRSVGERKKASAQRLERRTELAKVCGFREGLSIPPDPDCARHRGILITWVAKVQDNLLLRSEEKEDGSWSARPGPKPPNPSSPSSSSSSENLVPSIRVVVDNQGES